MFTSEFYIYSSAYTKASKDILNMKMEGGRDMTHFPSNKADIQHLKSLLKTFIVIKKWHNGVVMNSANHSADILELISPFARQLKKFNVKISQYSKLHPN